ncbi:MAG: hypothetical protein P0Y56_16790 [Candidatus Andeanibacterium colombiense]|uniref:Uncharacterized protein n=1 Tax=Candidatus Andeanibacterium colombiense TaxID=3121345 RepID=A0AAJ5X9N2_9SPHN|nr:MAG: hypothetical protein P0Y56_16790 [Sphingomonadaceae bacterium]
MAFDDKQLAGLLQGTRDFAGEMLEDAGKIMPFGGQVRPDGEIEFFAVVPAEDEITREAAYSQVEAALVERAGKGEIVAAVIVLDMVVPEAVETPLRDAIGILIETPDFCRFFHATFKLTPAFLAGAKASVEFGEIIPMEAEPAIFANAA